MKKLFFAILIVLLGLPMLAQEVRFPSTIVSAGGGSDGSSVNLSRWRLAPVHVLTLSEGHKIKKTANGHLPAQDWAVSIYPNPVEDFLHLEFELPDEIELFIKILDISGRVILIQEARQYVDGSTVELSMIGYLPALYLLQISSPDLTSQKVLRIQKL